MTNDAVSQRIGELEDANDRGAALIGEAMDVLAEGAPTARTVLTAVALMGRARIALGGAPIPLPDEGCARCHLYRTEMVSALEEGQRAIIARDHADGRLSLLGARVHEWITAQADGDQDDIDTATRALTGVSRMLDDVDLLTDVILVSREALHRRDRAIAAYRLAEMQKGP